MTTHWTTLKRFNSIQHILPQPYIDRRYPTHYMNTTVGLYNQLDLCKLSSQSQTSYSFVLVDYTYSYNLQQFR